MLTRNIPKVVLLFSFPILALLPSTLVTSIAQNDEIVVPKATRPADIDGMWSTRTEWTDASETVIMQNNLTAYLRAKYDETFVYILIDFISDQGLERSSDLAIVCFDTKNNGGNAPMSDDYCFYRITRAGDDLDGIIQGNGMEWIILQEAETWDPYDEKFDAAVAYSQMNDPYDSTNKHVIYEFRIPIESYYLAEMMKFYIYANDAYNDEFVQWPTNAGGKQFRSIVKDVLPAPNKWGSLHLKFYTPEGMRDERPKSPIVVTTDKTVYYTGETVKIEGSLPAVENGHEVNIIVKDANGSTFTKLMVKPTDNKFEASFRISSYDKLLPTGKWTINIGYSIWAAKVDINVLADEKRPVYSVTLSKAELVTAALKDIRVGHEVMIVSEVTNKEERDQHITYIVQVKNDLSNTVFLSWLTRDLYANEAIKFSVTWLPELEGEYTLETFAWDDIKSPTPLSPSQSVELTVNSG